MKIKSYWFLYFVLIATILIGVSAGAGVLKSLDRELSSLVSGTEPYLVTIKGDAGWRNLIATGIVFDPNGYILTSSQIFESSRFEVTFKGGRSYSAQKIGSDNLTGLAVLKINDIKFPIPKWGNSHELKYGALIAVVGNSFGVPSAANIGSFDGLTEDGLLRLSVDADPGSCGGAVLNTDGDLVGILLAKESDYHQGDSIFWAASTAPRTARLLSGEGPRTARCYAIPVELAKDIAGQIIKNGKVRRGFLGISSKNLDPAPPSGNTPKTGVVIRDVDKDSPAIKAGLMNGDIIAAVDSTTIANRTSLFNIIRSHKPGDIVTIEFFRDDKKLHSKAILGEALDKPFLSGLELSQSPKGQATNDHLALAESVDLKTEVERLRSEVTRLQTEVKDLKRQIAK